VPQVSSTSLFIIELTFYCISFSMTLVLRRGTYLQISSLRRLFTSTLYKQHTKNNPHYSRRAQGPECGRASRAAISATDMLKPKMFT
jgi:hypothetical protein